MIGHIFYWVINMSLVASLIGLPVLLIRCARFLPGRFLAFLWIPPFLHMILPIGIGTKFSFLSILSRFFTRTVVVEQPMDFIELSSTNVLSQASCYSPMAFPTERTENFFQFGGIIWLIVSVLLIIVITCIYHASFWQLRNANHLYGIFYESDRVSSPAVYGILRPRIVFPVGYAKEYREFAIDHEWTHIKRRDNLWRLLAVYLLAVHWFNPFCYLMFYLMTADTEVACDESVIMRYNDQDRLSYAKALVYGAEQNAAFFSPFFGAGVKNRIYRILNYREMTVFGTVCSCAFFFVLILFLMGYAK